MAQNLTLTAYLASRGKKAKALTKGEAALLGIPYPLQAGWPRKYGAMQIGEMMLERLVACAEVARQTAELKAARRSIRSPVVSPVDILEPPPIAPRSQRLSHSLPGFVIRKARRYRSRRPAPWA